MSKYVKWCATPATSSKSHGATEVPLNKGPQWGDNLAGQNASRRLAAGGCRRCCLVFLSWDDVNHAFTGRSKRWHMGEIGETYGRNMETWGRSRASRTLGDELREKYGIQTVRCSMGDGSDGWGGEPWWTLHHTGYLDETSGSGAGCDPQPMIAWYCWMCCA